jgi:hypothetical protein
MSDADNERTNREPQMIQSQSMTGEVSGSAGKPRRAEPPAAGELQSGAKGAFDELLTRRRRAAPALREFVSARWSSSARPNSSAAGNLPTGSSTSRASLTTFMAIRAAWNGPGSWTRSAVMAPDEWRRSKPASSSAPRC